MLKIEFALTPSNTGFHYWFNPETAPAWASLFVAIAAVVVAVVGNEQNRQNLLASLRQEIMRTNSESIRMADDLRNRMIAARSSNEAFIAREKIHPEVAEAFREILDLDDDINDLDPFKDENLKLVEAEPGASRATLESELHNALLLRTQFSAIPARFDAKVADLNRLIMSIAENPAARVREKVEHSSNGS